MPGKKILIVDDDDAMQEVLGRRFRKEGFQIMQAKTREEALLLYAEHGPHLVLLDIVLSGPGGLQTLKGLMKMDPQAKVVMISSVEDEDVMARCMELGAVDYLVKPFRASEIVTRILQNNEGL